ncbi:protein kinase [Nonomuraea sp. ATR24]|uniref:serine/threonine-protein kinase n=1 Tax=unclassified Nonomuraea TaxID=2593643 RepID=UPI0033C1B7EC
MATDGALGSRYILVEQIGAGGMGTVWRARHRDTGEIVAAKLLREGLAADRDLVLRFVQERNVMLNLRHPNIATVRDFVVEGDRLALVMDFVEGGDLRTLLHERGTLSAAEAARMVARIAGALAAAHDMGVIHRDVKPGNILIDAATGQPRLTDFGVARIVHGPGLTQTSSIIGTPTYLSPEVADGTTPTPAVDVYATGLILYELLAGRPPFVGEHPMALLRQHATAAPRRLPGMPDVLWTLITAATAKDPAARPTAAGLAEALTSAAPSLAGLPALPPVGLEHPPLATSQPLPGPYEPPVTADPQDARTRPPAPTGTPGTGGTPVAAGTGAVETSPGRGDGGRREAGKGAGRSRQRVLVGLATAAALVVSAGALVVVAPWRAQTVGAVSEATVEAPVEAQAPATASTEPEVPDTPTSKVLPIRSHPPKTPTAEPATTRPAPERTTRSPKPKPKTSPPTSADPEDPTTAEPETPPPAAAVNWRCRDWFSPTPGLQMSPCMAQVGDEFRLMGRIRGSASLRSDIHVQLYNTDAETNLSQPFLCAGVAPARDGAVVTCGPFTATASRTGAKVDVRQRWRKSGTGAFSGGVESPWVVW